MSRPHLAVAVVAAALLALPATAAAQTVAAPGAATTVREYAGTLVFSQFDAGSLRWFPAGPPRPRWGVPPGPAGRAPGRGGGCRSRRARARSTPTSAPTRTGAPS